MPNYEVGNLEIKFSALNEIDFEKLKDGLNKVKSAINNIGKIDTGRLDNFSRILSDLSTQFLPFLQGVEKASGGLAVFNDTLRQVGGRGGARGLSVAVTEFQKLKDATRETGEETQRLSVFITDATQDYLAQVRAAEEAALAEQRALEEQRRVIDELKNRYATYRDEFYRASREKPAILEDINTTKVAIQEMEGQLSVLKQQFIALGDPSNFNFAKAYQAQTLEEQIRGVEEVIGNLKVSLADLQAQFGAPFNEAQRAVSALKNELLNVYYATHTINEEQVQQAQELINKINETQRAIDRRFMSTQEQVIADQKEAIAKNQLEIAYLKAQMGLGKLNMTQEQYLAELQRLEAEQRRLRGELDETNDTQKETEKQTKKTTSGWKKFLNQIKRIAIYRLIRTALKAVVNTFKDTINAFAQVDDGVNNTMSNITSSLSIIKLSIGSSIIPLLQMIEPIVTQIAMAFANMANQINASLSKDGKFTKINTKAWKDYREQIEKTSGALLDFDKFRVLNQQQSTLSDFLEPNASVDEYFAENGRSETAERIKNIIQELSQTISDLFDILNRVGKPALDGISFALEPIAYFITSIVDGIKKLVDALDEVGALQYVIYAVEAGLALWGAYKIIRGIMNLTTKLGGLKTALSTVGLVAAEVFAVIGGWGDMNTFQKIAAVIGIVTTAFFGLAIAVGAAKSALTLGIAAAGIVAGITAVALAVGSAKQSAQGYAQGGLPDRGTLFYAGEAGAEMVYNMPSGQSGVANVSQIEQAFYNALVRYGRENRGSDGAINVNIDGQAVFKAVDREAGKRGLGFARR